MTHPYTKIIEGLAELDPAGARRALLELHGKYVLSAVTDNNTGFQQDLHTLRELGPKGAEIADRLARVFKVPADGYGQPETRLPMQPIETDISGVIRFKENRIVGNLLERYGNMNEIAKEATQGKYTAEEQMQFAQLIGYSVSGYCALPYVSDESAALAKSLITVLQSTHTTTEPKQ